MIDLETLIHAHAELRDRIAEKIHGEWQIKSPEYGLVLVKIFGYVFNTYKTIEILLPDLYYEQGGVLFRVLWESALNLAWITKEPESRARKFLQFTTVEYRRFLQSRLIESKQRNDSAETCLLQKNLQLFDEALENVLADYRFKNKKGRLKFQSRFSGNSIGELALELGGYWHKEYMQVYPLVCFYAHGTPGAVIFPQPIGEKLSPPDLEETDRPRTILLGLWSMAVMERIYRHFGEVVGIDDEKFLNDLNDKVHFR